MQKLLIATTNPGKFAELSSLLTTIPVSLVSVSDVGITLKPHETGKTFEENALIKANFYHNLSGLPTLADDGGFEIDALHGEPGVMSHRWVRKDRDADDEELIAYTMKKLENVPLAERGAQLRVVLAFTDGTTVVTGEGTIRGVVPLVPSSVRIAGYPYRSLLYLPDLKKYYIDRDLTAEEHDRLNHRKQALRLLIPQILKVLDING